ncbi:uncharacterized protein M6B38_345470 [Iris pallida]|uniref:AT3G52170-like helix-turn-helix domain-containing protein n=1 Tax=Iris pallida TaxID=29817 RepID=A0AAX6GU83_IRIPA|nr:uncharacterized protein M6B38_345470 [Iris pallida]
MNMQAVCNGGTGKAFALSRCSASREKKPRSRRTKEERKTMVESFIKTYRDLNNGKFPSFSLTHKEVGGSFYIVREIMREIIQDNRVLGPGNINSKVLNLEDCCEEHAVEYISTDSSGHLSIATLNQPTVEEQEIISSASTEHRSEEIIGTDNFGAQEFATHLNDLPFLQVMDGEKHHDDFSNGIFLNTNSINLGYKETKFGKPSGEEDDNSVGFEEMCDEVQVKGKQDTGTCIIEQQILRETISSTSAIREYTVNGEEPGNNMAKETNSSASHNSAPKITEAYSLSETNVILNSITDSVSDQVQYSSCDIEDSLFASTATKTCIPVNFREVDESSINLEVSNTSAVEMEVEEERFGKSLIVNKAESEELHSSSVVEEISAECQSKPISDDFPANLQPMLHPDGSQCVTNNTINASVLLEAGYAHGASDTVTASNSSSISSEEPSKEPEAPQINPVWAAIKSFMSGVVKFWTE